VPILRLSAFEANTAKEVERLLRQQMRLKGAVARLLVDLRGGARGDAPSAYAVAALFADGELGATMARGLEQETFRGAPPLWTGQLVVLVDRSTLGPAEILATVLRQSAAARVVGERTFGYAGRQKVVSLPSGGVIELTDAFYTGPDRKRLERGLRPDVLVDERSRSFAERDVPIEQLILERGLEVVRQEPDAPARAA
jgi:carboxyl-terminal processing protease